MCEMLVRVVDKTSDDPYKDCKLLKAGDVVTIQADGWAWTPAELSNPDWRIVKLPNVALAAALKYLARETDVDVANPSRVLRNRSYWFDLWDSSLPLALRTWVLDASRAAPTRTINLTGAQIVAYLKSKTPLTDPNVIG